MFMLCRHASACMACFVLEKSMMQIFMKKAGLNVMHVGMLYMDIGLYTDVRPVEHA